jgi:hypothetical protein
MERPLGLNAENQSASIQRRAEPVKLCMSLKSPDDTSIKA